MINRKFWTNPLQAVNGLVTDNEFNLNPEKGLKEFRIEIKECEIPNIRIVSLVLIRAKF